MKPPAKKKWRSIHKIDQPSLLAAQDRDPKPPRPTPEKPLVISASELRDWLRCRVKHHWRHQVQLVQIGGAVNLALGGLVHDLLEKWYALPYKERTQRAMEKIARLRMKETTPKELSIENLELVTAMCVGYAAWAVEEDAEIGLKNCTPEMWFDLPLTKDGCIRVVGKIDNVFEALKWKSTMACFEHKTKKQVKLDIVEMNLQISIYLWALRQLFPNYKRYKAFYQVLRKQLPSKRVTAPLFVREEVERTDEEIDQWAIDTERAVMDMAGAAVYPNPTDSCQWDCDYKIPCLLRGNPRDLKHVLRTEFITKDEQRQQEEARIARAKKRSSSKKEN